MTLKEGSTLNWGTYGCVSTRTVTSIVASIFRSMRKTSVYSVIVISEICKKTKTEGEQFFSNEAKNSHTCNVF